MPNRTIYISDADLPVFERAQQLAGENLSATIVQALRRFVDAHERRISGFRPVTVKVGKHAYSQKQFTGRLLAKGRFMSAPSEQPEEDAPGDFFASWSRSVGLTGKEEVFEVYQTQKGKFVLYIRRGPSWGRWSPRWNRHEWREWARQERMEGQQKRYNWPGWQGRRDREGHGDHEAFDWDEWWHTEYVLEIYDDLDAIKDHVPEELYHVARQNLSGNSVEILDI
ncbi:MAG TPA: EXLDI protein [Aggregatilineales bacterium]|nr:EXLDI protein [Aggregatilineales bacterium]